MKIGIDARLWGERGVGRYIRNLVKYLQVLDKENDYVLFVRSKDHKNIQFQISNFKFQIVNADIRWHTVEEQLKLPSILNKEKLDLVHFPYFSVPIFYNRTYVVTIHDLILHHFPTGEASTLPLPLYKLKLLGYKFVISQAAKRAKKIITVSQATKSEIVDHLGVNPDKVMVTYEGVSHKISNLPFGKKLAQGKQSQIAKVQLKTQNFFLYVGNAYPHKNLERLLEVFNKFMQISQVLRTRPARSEAQLVLVGKEDYFYKRLKEKVKKMNFVNNVIFFGEASDGELRSLYQNAKALVLPSLMEGFGLPAVEAMANRCLVLCSDIPALREVCGDGAIYFNPYDVNDICRKMEDLCFNDLNLPRARSRGHFSKNIEEGLRRVKMFSWQNLAKQTLKIYKSI